MDRFRQHYVSGFVLRHLNQGLFRCSFYIKLQITAAGLSAYGFNGIPCFHFHNIVLFHPDQTYIPEQPSVIRPVIIQSMREHILFFTVVCDYTDLVFPPYCQISYIQLKGRISRACMASCRYSVYKYPGRMKYTTKIQHCPVPWHFIQFNFCYIFCRSSVKLYRPLIFHIPCIRKRHSFFKSKLRDFKIPIL